MTAGGRCNKCDQAAEGSALFPGRRCGAALLPKAVVMKQLSCPTPP